jgi:hypothetical protein
MTFLLSCGLVLDEFFQKGEAELYAWSIYVIVAVLAFSSAYEERSI